MRKIPVLDKFDPYAWIDPKNPEDITAILREALSVANDINEILEKVGKDCQRDKDNE